MGAAENPLFERGALFSALTVTENVGMVLHEHTPLDARLIEEIAALKIALSGLPADAGVDEARAELEETIQEAERLVRSVTRSPELGLTQRKHRRTDNKQKKKTPVSAKK
mgnify:CR=1 FL=1